MSSLGTMREITPLLPWRPAILSPGCSFRFTATKTLTIFMTPGGSSSPRCSFSTLLSKRDVRPVTASSICFLKPSISAILASSRIEICFHCAGAYSASTASVISVPDFMPRGPPTAISPSINSLSLACHRSIGIENSFPANGEATTQGRCTFERHVRGVTVASFPVNPRSCRCCAAILVIEHRTLRSPPAGPGNRWSQ